jgi:hypothetical protein
MGTALEFEVEREGTDWVRGLVVVFPPLVGRAVKSAGHMIAKTAKAQMRAGMPGGKAMAERMPDEKRAKLEGAASGTKYPYFGHMVQAFRYHYNEDSLWVDVGWLPKYKGGWTGGSKASELLGRKLQEGQSVFVTKRMRRRLFHRGIFLRRGKTTIDLPARPVVDPVWDWVRPKLKPHIEARIRQYLDGDFEDGKGNQWLS